jgi:hypothetical protein
VLTGSFTVATVLAGSYSVTVTGNPDGDFASSTFMVSVSSTQTTTVASTYVTQTSSSTITSSTYPTTPVSGTHVTLQLSTTDANGKLTSSFTGGGTVLVRAVLINDGSVPLNNAYLLISIYDSNNVPIFTGVSVTSLNVGQQVRVSLGPTLPATVVTGTYLVQVIVLTSFLNAGGVPVPGGVGAVTFTVN